MIQEGRDGQLFWFCKSQDDVEEVKLDLYKIEAGNVRPEKFEVPKDSMLYKEYTREKDSHSFDIYTIVPTLFKDTIDSNVLAYKYNEKDGKSSVCFFDLGQTRDIIQA